MSIDPLAPSSAFDERLRDRLRADAGGAAGEGAVADDEDEDERPDLSAPRAPAPDDDLDDLDQYDNEDVEEIEEIVRPLYSITQSADAPHLGS